MSKPWIADEPEMLTTNRRGVLLGYYGPVERGAGHLLHWTDERGHRCPVLARRSHAAAPLSTVTCGKPR